MKFKELNVNLQRHDVLNNSTRQELVKQRTEYEGSVEQFDLPDDSPAQS